MTQVEGGGVPAGTQLNGIYEIEERIAAGGMGEVYTGRLIQTGDKVAIKMILPEHANNELILDLFRKEASTLHGLYHEAIVRYYVFSVDPVLGRPYLAMEFAGGPALGDRVQSYPLTEDEMAVMLPRIAGGLHAAHRAGIVHRDLSPDNIILVDNDVSRAKIIDFGIAKAQGSDGTLIGSGFAGKLKYVSPEQLGLAGGEVTAQSDIYSLGLVLAEAAVGYPLDMGGSQVEVIEKRRTVPDLTPVPAYIRPLLEWMLQPEAADRPATMDEVAKWQPAPSRTSSKKGRGSSAGAAAGHPRDRGEPREKSGGGGLKLLGVLLAGTAIAGAAAFYVMNDNAGAPGRNGGEEGRIAENDSASLKPGAISSGDTASSGGAGKAPSAGGGSARSDDASITALPGGGEPASTGADDRTGTGDTIALPGGGATVGAGGTKDTTTSGDGSGTSTLALPGGEPTGSADSGTSGSGTGTATSSATGLTSDANGTPTISTAADSTVATSADARTGDNGSGDGTIALSGGGATAPTEGSKDAVSGDPASTGAGPGADATSPLKGVPSGPADDDTTVALAPTQPGRGDGPASDTAGSGETTAGLTPVRPEETDTATAGDRGEGSSSGGGLTPVPAKDGKTDAATPAPTTDGTATTDSAATASGAGEDATNGSASAEKDTSTARSDDDPPRDLSEPKVPTNAPGGLSTGDATELAVLPRTDGGGLRPATIGDATTPGTLGAPTGVGGGLAPITPADITPGPAIGGSGGTPVLPAPGTSDSSGVATNGSSGGGGLDRADPGTPSLDASGGVSGPSLATRPVDDSDGDPADALAEPTVNTALPAGGLATPSGSGGLAPVATGSGAGDGGFALPRTGSDAPTPAAPVTPQGDTTKLAAVAAPENQPPTIRDRAPDTLSADQGKPLKARLGEFFDEDGAQNLELKIQGDVPNGLNITMGRDGIAELTGVPAEYGEYNLKIAAIDSDGLLSQSISVLLRVDRPTENQFVRDYILSYDGGECFLSRAVELGPQTARIEVFAAESEIPKVIAFDEDFKADNGFEAMIGMRPISPDQCTLVKVLNQVGPQALDNSLIIRMIEDQLTSGDRLVGKIQGGQNARLFLFDNLAGITDLSEFVETRGGETGFALEIAGTGPQILIAARPRDGSGIGPDASLNQLLAAAQQGRASLALGFFTLK